MSKLQEKTWLTMLEKAINEKNSRLSQMLLDKLLDSKGYDGYLYFLHARCQVLQKKYISAIKSCQLALAGDELNSQQLCLTYNLLGRIYQHIDSAKAVEMNYKAFMAADSLEYRLRCYSNYLLSLQYLDLSAEEYLARGLEYGALFKTIPQEKFSIGEYNHRKLRIGYLSPDLHRHVVACFVWPMFKYYDKDNFEVYTYSSCQADDVTVKFMEQCDVWRDVANQTWGDIAKLIKQDEIDILVDLAGHTAGTLLPVFAYRSAPIQLSGIGYFSTTGLSETDGFIVDDYTIRGSAGKEFVEDMITLSHSHFCYSREFLPEENYDRVGKKNANTICFGCFNSYSKFSDELLTAWGKLLQKIPDSYLYLKCSFYDTEEQRSLVLERLEKFDIPVDRVKLEGYTAVYLPCYQEVDIALDTYPYPGGGTTCDAIYMGVPVITLAGSLHHTRFGASLLHNVGCDELIAESWREYVDITIELCRDKRRLNLYHHSLRQQMENSPLMDGEAYVAELESKYHSIYRKKHSIVGDEDFLQIGFQAYLHGCYGRAEYWLEEAVYREAQNHMEACLYLAQVYDSRYKYVSAYKMYKKAAQDLLRERHKGTPEFQYRVWQNYACAALRLGYIKEAALGYKLASQQGVDLSNQLMAYSSYLLTLHYDFVNEIDIIQAHREYRHFFAHVIPYSHESRRSTFRRIGLLSPDWRHHVMENFLPALFTLKNYGLEVYVFSLVANPDDYTAAYQHMADGWYNLVGLNYEDAAKMIYDLGVDILIDLAGHSVNNGLPILAYQPSPIQISGLGYINITGLPNVQYIISDKNVWCEKQNIPEQSLMLESQFCYQPVQEWPVSDGAPCLKKGYVQFGVFNNYGKITDKMLKLWGRIIQLVPDGRILFKSQVFISQEVQLEARQRMLNLGLPIERISFEPATEDYMLRYLDIDIALDTYPYPGGGTTCDALWMGVPVISLYGLRSNTKFGLDILSQIGMEMLATDSVDRYVSLAIELVRHPQLLNDLHNNLRQKMQASSLCETMAYGEDWYQALARIHQEIWC